MAPEPLRTDLVLTALGALGTLGYALHVVRNRTRSPLEARALLLLAALGTLLAVRIWHWLAPAHAGWDRATFVPATLLPLAMTLFVEGLLRRHLPRWMKAAAVAATGVFFVLNLALGGEARAAAMGRAFPVALAAVMALLGGFLLLRRRDTLSRAENDLVAACLAVTAVAIPLAITDFREVLGFPSHRLGAIGVLLFVYTLARAAELEERAAWARRDLPWFLLRSGLLAAVLYLATGPGTPGRLLGAAALSAALLLLFHIGERVRAAGARDRSRALLHWLAAAPTESLGAFLDALDDYPLTRGHVVLGPAELAAYDADALLALFDAEGGTCSTAVLRSLAGSEAAEQVLDLLATHQTTHASLLSRTPLRLLLVSLPDLAGAQDAEVELRVLQREAGLAARTEAVHAA